MKKVLVMIITAVCLNNGMTAASIKPSNIETQTLVTVNKFSKISIKDIPEKILQTIEKEYPCCYIFETYIGYLGGLTIYKIELIDNTGESFFIIINEEGKNIQ